MFGMNCNFRLIAAGAQRGKKSKQITLLSVSWIMHLFTRIELFRGVTFKTISSWTILIKYSGPIPSYINRLILFRFVITISWTFVGLLTCGGVQFGQVVGHACLHLHTHYSDVIMSTMASQIISFATVYLTVYSDADQNKHQSSASLAFVWGIHRDRWIPRTNGQ